MVGDGELGRDQQTLRTGTEVEAANEPISQRSCWEIGGTADPSAFGRGIRSVPRFRHKDLRSFSSPTESSLSGAPHRLIAWYSACGAESKGLGGACLAYAARSFSTTEAAPSEPTAVVPPGPRTKNLLASQQILLSGSGGREARSSIGKTSTAEVLRLRATGPVSRDKSVRRSAQDDDSVGEPKEKQQAPLRSG
jgi:hypothetical protein